MCFVGLHVPSMAGIDYMSLKFDREEEPAAGPGQFEPIHGSAPDIIGQNKTNLLVTVLSVAMLLRYGLHEENAARIIESAVLETLNKGFRIGDIF
ncbi:hypothetical protein IFM89_031725 [Coptis chinensis]|uniref:Isopropylmalate dehydrogenase-like domain-containing protein n=1 Tax=Coptis chinensis TaxID=261450 RepID=A0A835IJA8_9MAGN|nr:hypothetical protein IFM89_031725 [Coptis chinensis]